MAGRQNELIYQVPANPNHVGDRGPSQRFGGDVGRGGGSASTGPLPISTSGGPRPPAHQPSAPEMPSHGGGGGGGGGAGENDLVTQIDEVKVEDVPMPEWATVKIDNKHLTGYQLNNLLDENSDYIRGARYRGQLDAQSRGLWNSTLAVEAGETAAINAALPIAQQHAEAYLTEELANVNAENTFKLENFKGDREVALAEYQQHTTALLTQLEGAIQKDIEHIRGNYQLQGLSMELAAQAAEGHANRIHEIYTTPGLTPEQQETAVAIQNGSSGHSRAAFRFTNGV